MKGDADENLQENGSMTLLKNRKLAAQKITSKNDHRREQWANACPGKYEYAHMSCELISYHDLDFCTRCFVSLLYFPLIFHFP